MEWFFVQNEIQNRTGRNNYKSQHFMMYMIMGAPLPSPPTD